MSYRYRASPGGLRLRKRRNPLARIVFCGLALAFCAQIGLLLLDGPEQPPVAVPQPPVASSQQPGRSAFLDAGALLGQQASGFSAVAPLPARFQPALQPSAATALAGAFPAEALPPVRSDIAEAAVAADRDVASAAPVPEPSPSVAPIPLPRPRPSDLKLPTVNETPRLAGTRPARRPRPATAQATQEDNRSFFEKLFGVQPKSPAPTLAYAAPEDDLIDRGRGRRLSPSLPSAPTTAAFTAIYDISARTVYMPNGERLEAHSGLGDKMDDPRFVHVRMKGATPPHTYNLTEREALFHGVRALRMHPVGGAGAIHGRTGLLTHSYLLGPRGDSNGCISFKDYDRFLQAWLRGEVKRIVVVASLRDSAIAIASR